MKQIDCVWLLKHLLSGQLRNVLSVGSDLPLLSLWTTFRYITDARGVLDAGMRKVSCQKLNSNQYLHMNQWPRRIFRVPTLSGWEVVLTEPSVIDELRKAPDNIMGASEAFDYVRAPTFPSTFILNDWDSASRFKRNGRLAQMSLLTAIIFLLLERSPEHFHKSYQNYTKRWFWLSTNTYLQPNVSIPVTRSLKPAHPNL